MTMTWTLIIFMGFSGSGWFSTSTAITSQTVPGFTTSSACEISRDIFVNSLEYKRHTIARCVEVR